MDEKRVLGLPPSLIRYTLVGAFNTVFNLAVLNVLMYVTGITSGGWLLALSWVSFFITLTQSYIWNKWWVFRRASERVPGQFGKFGAVAIVTAVASTGLLHLLVNEIGAPAGIPPQWWVNAVVLVLVPVSFVGNYWGNRLLVFRDH